MTQLCKEGRNWRATERGSRYFTNDAIPCATYQSGGAVWFAMSSFFICSKIQTSDINLVRNDSSNAMSAFAGSPGGTWFVFDAIHEAYQR